MHLTYRYRVKDGSGACRYSLRAQARSVNFVWNYLCSVQRESERRWSAGVHREQSRWPSAFDLTYLTAGCAAELGVHSDTITALCHRFAQSRDAKRMCPRWRSAKTNMDWVPLAKANKNVRIANGVVRFRKRFYRLWWTRDLPSDAKIKTASFNADARGRWYFNVTFETNEVRPHGDGEIGIDLGLKTLAMTSDGEAIPNLRHTARYADALAKAQRAKNKRRVRAIHAKIANARRDHLHKVSTRLMRANRRIIVGNVSASKLAKTRMAKSVLDAGWSSFRAMLAYKAIAHQVEYAEVDEAYSSQVCSACGSLPTSRPRGIADLGVREWRCDDCGTTHDRDVNAARNILLGATRRPPAVGIAA